VYVIDRSVKDLQQHICYYERTANKLVADVLHIETGRTLTSPNQYAYSHSGHNPVTNLPNWGRKSFQSDEMHMSALMSVGVIIINLMANFQRIDGDRLSSNHCRRLL
jgi:hypothetical protein